MKGITSLLSCFLLCGGLYAQVGTTTTTTTRTVTTETTVTTKVTKPFVKVAVLDFGSADTIGLKLLEHLPSAKTDNNEALTTEDRGSINNVMQGFVKLLEVATNNKVRDEKDEEFIASQIPAEDLLGFIHYNTEVMDADRQGSSPYDFSQKLLEEIRIIKDKIDKSEQ